MDKISNNNNSSAKQAEASVGNMTYRTDPKNGNKVSLYPALIFGERRGLLCRTGFGN